MASKFFRFLFSLLILMSPCWSLQAAVSYLAADETEPQVLVLKFTNGSTADIMLADKPEITFEEGKLKVTSDVAETAYNRTDVAEFYFAATPTGIQQNAADSFSLRYTDNATIHISGLETTAYLYDANGKLLKQVPVSASGTTIQLNSYMPGIYVLKLGNSHNYKIIKR